MAQRRMFSPDIVESEEFLDMPHSSQSLYFHLSMRADDDGFVQPKMVMRLIGSNNDDLKVLLGKRFLLPFKSGVVVIKHWLIHNMIRKDRYKETRFIKEKGQLFLKDNNVYTDNENKGKNLLATNWQPIGNHSAPQVRLGKVRLGKDSIDMSAFNQFWDKYPKKELKSKSIEVWNKNNLDGKLDEILDFIEKAKNTERWQKGYIKQPPTFLRNKCWEDDLSAYGQSVKQKVEGKYKNIKQTTI